MQPTALLSVSDKSGLIDFARALAGDLGYRLLSTGGTARTLRENGLEVIDVSDWTGFPEMMEGRVKTLHPKVHGGLLCRRDSEDHLAAARSHGIELIDLVAVNLYPFEQTVARPDIDRAEGIEMIDIGGPSMLRSAAKNADAVTVLCDPTDYPATLAALKSGDAAALSALRRRLAAKVFARTAAYDRAIASWLETQTDEPDPDLLAGFPPTLTLQWPRVQRLRYGENPHQQAALYGTFFDHFEKLHGKELSYNNILDVTAASFLIGEFQRPTAAIIKHTNPCGVASADTLEEAWAAAYATDTQAPFGGIIIVNRTLDEALAEPLGGLFCEIVIAPEFTPGALALLRKKKNLRLLVSRERMGAEALQEVRSVIGGVLVQDRDRAPVNPAEFRVVTRRQPTAEELAGLHFAWRVVRHVKSNAIVYGRGERTLGVGAGQMARVDSSRIAVWKAGQSGLDLRGSVVASEALFPFADGLIAAAEAGATAAIQPGGSIRDEEVIAAADDRGLAMIFTGRRHFRH
ncbi:MAG: bifunctional phosphoribosylaminoimidazolecarboxamide formyltransferase/IMP cyclohydrolase PurH [Puniceicoccaceae bacterium]|nr:MAG: bifunctional phosphoribosylaminoimidazolecarboxamide formyltransferase/IMP cyclohydrolase PurH [Puniceicoccaceae bacterium]